MSQPTRSQLSNSDAVLTALAIRFLQSQTVYVSTDVFPICPVNQQGGKYRIWGKENLRDEAKIRASGAEAAIVGFSLSKDSYDCEVFAAKAPISNQDRANADADLALDQATTELVTGKHLLRREVDWMAKFFTTGVWSVDKAVANKWSDYANSNPFQDLRDGKTAILKGTGFKPNKLVLGYEVWAYLEEHPDLIDAMGLGGSATEVRKVTTRVLAEKLGLDKVLVAEAVYNTAKEGQADALDFVAGKSALLCYSAPSPSLVVPSAGYTFAWRGITGGQAVAIDRYYDSKTKSDWIEGESAFDHKVTSAALGYFFPSVVD